MVDLRNGIDVVLNTTFFLLVCKKQVEAVTCLICASSLFSNCHFLLECVVQPSWLK